MGRLDGRVAIVTGAKIADDGGANIGSATASAMAAEGAAVVVSDLDGAGAERLAEEIQARGGGALAMQSDIAVESHWEAAVSTALDRFGRLDVLVNNAAYFDFANDVDPVTMELAVWNKTMEINTGGTMLGCKHAIPAMLDHGGGSIVNVISAQALAGQMTRTAYAASKGAIMTLTKYVAAIYGKQGIRCNAIAPGLTLSALVKRSVADGVRAAHLRHSLSDRVSDPDDIAYAALFLASPESAQINGHVLPVDGGISSVRAITADLAELDTQYQPGADEQS